MGLRSQSIEVEVADALQISENGHKILSYQISEKSHNGTYTRSNYIHPLYSLDGAIMTEDFPEDHLHHRGIFWTWHQVYIGDKRIGDPWEIKDFSWSVDTIREVESNEKGTSIAMDVFWKSPLWKDSAGVEKTMAREVVKIRVFPREKDYRIIDIEISILALEEDMRLGGSEDAKGYGGFSPRIRLPEDIVFSSGNGEVKPTNLPVVAAPWMDITGSLGKNGAKAGMSIFCHPDNPGTSEQWILRSKRSMQNAVFPFPGAAAIPLSNEDPLVLSYRLVVHNEKVETSDIAELYNDYSGK